MNRVALRARFPWQRFQYERLTLLLIALALLPIVKPINVQDHSRLALSESIITRGSLEIDPWIYAAGDRARFGGHWYSDKAPGLSFAALPAVALSQTVPGNEPWTGTWRRWLMRLLINGPLLLALCLMLGRSAEGLVPGTGGIVAVVTGIGTLLGPLAGVLFEHVGATALTTTAFLLVWRRRPLFAGLAAGCCVLWEYQAAIAVVAIGAYAMFLGARPLAHYLLGMVPSAVVLAVYDQLAFGSPLHLSYRYVANDYTAQQQQGFFGVGVPSVSDLHAVLTGGSGLRPGVGLLSTSPALVVAAAGLVLLWRRGLQAEAATCAITAVAFIVWDAGYFAPFGGQSPGPRFAATGLGLLLVGLPLALGRFPRTTIAVCAASVALSLFNALRWGPNDGFTLTTLPATVWSLAGTSRAMGVAISFAFAAAAALTAFLGAGTLFSRERRCVDKHA